LKRVRVPEILTYPGFVSYWSGVVFSTVGTRATGIANLYHVFALTGSTAQVGLVGLSQGVSLIVLSLFGGVLADRVDRRRLVQLTQLVSMTVSLGLAVLTYVGSIEAWHIYPAVMLNTAASTFDNPARTALIPALLPRSKLPQAFALLTPSRELSFLVGPALAGLLIAVDGPGLVYLFDAVTYLTLIVLLALLHVPKVIPTTPLVSIRASVLEGIRFVRARPVISQLLGLDITANLFGAYMVVLPALSLDVLGVGPAGYGLLASAPPAGALLATFGVLQLIKRWPAGDLVLMATVGYGLACVFLAQSTMLVLALMAGGLVGATDALASSVRAAAVQLETPDELRGRVTSIFYLAVRGGPALGAANLGWMAGVFGPVNALTLGAAAPVAHAAVVWLRGGAVRDYRVPVSERAT
jgi:MFS family permease